MRRAIYPLLDPSAAGCPRAALLQAGTVFVKAVAAYRTTSEATWDTIFNHLHRTGMTALGLSVRIKIDMVALPQA